METFLDIFLHDRIFGRTLAMRCATALALGLLVVAGTWWLMDAVHWGYAGIAAGLGLVAKDFGVVDEGPFPFGFGCSVHHDFTGIDSQQ